MIPKVLIFKINFSKIWENTKQTTKESYHIALIKARLDNLMLS